MVICKVVLALSGTGAAPAEEIHIIMNISSICQGGVHVFLTCRSARCGSGHRPHLQQVGHRIHLYLWRVSQTLPEPWIIQKTSDWSDSLAVCRNIVAIVSETLTVYTFVQFFDALVVCWRTEQIYRRHSDGRLSVGHLWIFSACPRGFSSALGCSPSSPFPTWFPTTLLVCRWE